MQDPSAWEVKSNGVETAKFPKSAIIYGALMDLIIHKRKITFYNLKQNIVDSSICVPSAELLDQDVVSELKEKISVSLNMFRELWKDRVTYFSLSELEKRRA